MIRKLSVVVAAVVLFAAAPQQAQSQVLLGPSASFSSEYDFGVGATIMFGLPSVTPGLGVMGDFLIYFPDNFDYWEFNANATYDIQVKDSKVAPFVLAGLNVGHASLDIGEDYPDFDFSDSTTDIGLNLGGGIAFNVGKFRPRVTAKFILGGVESGAFAVIGTLPFVIAGD
jgi:hypothetical protein